MLLLEISAAVVSHTIHLHICLELDCLDCFYLFIVFDLCIFLSWFRRDKIIIWLIDSYFSQRQQFEVKNILIMFLSAVWTLILAAPIHYRASIAEQVM